ncbi:MAG: glycosyltransferase [Cyanobacteria bacterium J06641_5]
MQARYVDRYPFVSVLVPVFNDGGRLKLCLDALEHQTYPRNLYEVVVIDNGSSEDVECIVNAFEQALICFESAPGSYAARNKGISLAKGEIIAFTDADCIPSDVWIKEGISKFLDTSNCGLIAGRIELFFKDALRPTAVEVYESIEMGFSQNILLEEQQYALTANLFTSKDIIEAVGSFNGALKSGGDCEWGQRVFAAGYNQVYAPNALVKHPARSSLWQLYKRVTRINGGYFDKKKATVSRLDRIRGLIKDLILALTPPFRSVFHIWSKEERLSTSTQKIQFILVMLFVRYVGAWERIRLRLGGSSRRW